MPPIASRRWLLAGAALVALATAALWPKVADRSRAEPRAASTTRPESIRPQEGASPSPPEIAPVADAAAGQEWRLEVEVTDENGTPIVGRLYVTDSKGDLIAAHDTEPPAPLVLDVRGTVGVTAYVVDYVPQFFDGLTAPDAGDVRPLVVRVERGPGIAGTIVDEAGAPAEALIWAQPLDPPAWLLRKSESWRMYAGNDGRWFRFHSSTEDDGSFRIDGLPPGRYGIECEPYPSGRDDGKTALLRPEVVVGAVGDRDVRIVCRRSVEVRVHLVDEATGESLSGSIGTWAAENEDWWESGSGAVGALVYDVAPKASFTFEADIQGYNTPGQMLITANGEPGIQHVTVKLRLDPGGMAELALVVRDDTGAPAPSLVVMHGDHWQPRASEDGHYLLTIPAGRQAIHILTSSHETLRFRREWIVSQGERDEWRPPGVYVSQWVQVDLPRGGRVTREVTMQRAALIWVRHEREEGFEARLLRDDEEVKNAFEVLPMSTGRVAAVAPGVYTVETRAGGKVAKVEVTANAAEVVEVWARPGDAK